MEKSKRRFMATVLTLSLAAFTTLTGVSQTPPPSDHNIATQITTIHNRHNTITSISTSSGEKLSPASDAAELPFRLVMTYSHQGKVSSDPEFLAGVDGLVEINAAIYNTTGRMETINVDVDGRAVSRQRLVSTPLSIAGSVTLDDINASEVVTSTETTTDGPVSNGVVGVDSSGKTFVQWAALTGIKPMGSVARFSLVVNAKNFHVPTMNLAVSPGFGIHDTSTANDNALVISTLQTLTQTNQILDESGKALEHAHKQLNEAGSHIATQTIKDLQTSSRDIDNNTQTTIATLNQISAQANATYLATGSLVSQQLTQTTESMKNLLGDPTRPAPKITINSDTCHITVESAESSLDNTDIPADKSQERGAPVTNLEAAEFQGANVLDVIRGLAARLNALAETSSRCQAAVLRDLDTLLGPSSPDEQTCTQSNGLSCALLSQRKAMDATVKQIAVRNAEFTTKLRSGSQHKTLTSIKELSTHLDNLKASVDTLDSLKSNASVKQHLKNLDDSLLQVDKELEKTRTQLEKINIHVETLLTASRHQAEKITQLTREICLASGRTQPSNNTVTGSPTIDESEAEKLLGLLSSNKCPDIDPGEGQPFNSDSGENDESSIQGMNTRMSTTLQSIHSATNLDPSIPVASQSDLVQALNKTEENLANVKKSLKKINDSRSTHSMTLNRHIRAVKNELANVDKSFALVDSYATKLGQELTTLGSDMDQFITSTQTKAREHNETTLHQSLVTLNKTRDRTGETTQRLFGTFRHDLTSQSDYLIATGDQAVGNANKSVADTNNSLSFQTRNLMHINSIQVQNMTTKAVADSHTVSNLLSDDITKVLSDIGHNTNDGGGLLGAINASSGYLTIADGKIADASTHTQITRSDQRAIYGTSLFDSAVTRASLARLESPLVFTSSHGKVTAAWINVHVESGKK